VQAGKWLKLLGGAGCYIYLHTLTHEYLSNRPPDFEEEVAEAPKFDPAQGFETCEMTDLLEVLDTCIDDEQKTPLLIDASGEESLLATFFSYKGILADATALGLPLAQQRKRKIRPRDVMESLRQSAVNAIKAGATLAVNFGNMGSDANFTEKLCKRDGFPVEMFEQGGKRILTPNFPEPRCAKMFRDADKEEGYVKALDTFRLVLISTLPVTDVKQDLMKGLPSEHVKPIYVTNGST